jgi:hypothetical protein
MLQSQAHPHFWSTRDFSSSSGHTQCSSDTVKMQSSWKPEIRNKATASRGGIRDWFPWRNVTWTGDKVGYKPRIDRSQAVMEQLPKLGFPRSNGLIRTTKTSRRFKKRCSLNPGILPSLHIFTYTRPRWNASSSNAHIKTLVSPLATSSEEQITLRIALLLCMDVIIIIIIIFETSFLAAIFYAGHGSSNHYNTNCIHCKSIYSETSLIRNPQ